jgi:hypothetical protein
LIRRLTGLRRPQAASLERFQARWPPARVKKTRQKSGCVNNKVSDEPRQRR